MADYTVKVVDRSAAGAGYFIDAHRIAPMRSVLNAAGSTTITGLNEKIPAGAVVPIRDEVQVYRDGARIRRFVVTKAESTWDLGGTTDDVDFSCRGLEWYFDQLRIGRTDRTNYLATNPEFESGTTGWTAAGVTFTTDTTRRKTGTRSAKLVQASQGTDTFITQSASITGGGVGALVTLAVWYFIEDTGWVGPALDSRGIHLERRDSAGTLKEFRVEEIDNDTPRGVWLRAEVSVTVPAGATETVYARLYAPGTTGGIRYDSASLTVMESLSYYSTDQATIAAGIVSHLQSTTYSKFNLGITTSAAATGVLRDRHWQFAEHANGGRAIADFADLDNGFDFEITDDRTFVTHYPRRGRLQAPVTIDDVARVRWVPLDGDQAANSITQLGEGDGPDREEGGAIDTAAFGGPVIEDVLAPVPGLDVDALDAKANEALRLRKVPRLLEVTLKPSYRLFDLYPGDTCVVTISHGYMQVSGTWRITETTLDPATDSLSFVANAA